MDPATDPPVPLSVLRVVLSERVRMELPAGEIHVWFHDADVAPAALDGLAPVLNPAELARASRYHFEADRRRSIVARASLRIHLSHYCGVEAASILIGAADGAKPEAPATGVQFNVSHAGDVVALAFSAACPVGLDVERIRPMRDAQGIARRYFSADEQRALDASADVDDTFFRIWTAKEALVKGTGKGLSSELAAFTVPFASAALAPVQAEPGVGLEGWSVASLDDPREGYRAAVAARTGHATLRVTNATVDSLLA